MLFFEIHPDIHKAQTLPAEAYRSHALYEDIQEKILARSWQLCGTRTELAEPVTAVPKIFLPGSVHEPLLLTRAAHNQLHCHSNVCTHRGSLLLDRPSETRFIRCPYHNRCFDLNGHCRSASGFEDVADFPRAQDHLPRLPLEDWHGFLFAALDPLMPFADWIEPVQARLGWVPWKHFQYQSSQDFVADVNFMLYIDNYLEGFHIPYVHPGLKQVLDPEHYETTPLEWGVLQTGFAATPDVPVFDLPSFHPDAGQQVAAYYFWLFPNLMFNLYPWGLSLNLILPEGLNRTRIHYQTWLWKSELLHQGAGAGLDQVEQEDQAIIARVQQGIRSRLYQRGRYAPTQEVGVHHFHRLLAHALHAGT